MRPRLWGSPKDGLAGGPFSELMEAADSECMCSNDLSSDGIKERLMRIEARPGREVARHRSACRSRELVCP
jgi:hypothetical protein